MLSTDQKGIMICLGGGGLKLQKFFLDKGYYENEGFNLDMNIMCLMCSAQNKSFY